MAEKETRRAFREKMDRFLSGRAVPVERLTRELIREGCSRDMIPAALRGVGVSVDGEGWATLRSGPRRISSLISYSNVESYFLYVSNRCFHEGLGRGPLSSYPHLVGSCPSSRMSRGAHPSSPSPHGGTLTPC